MKSFDVTQEYLCTVMVIWLWIHFANNEFLKSIDIYILYLYFYENKNIILWKQKKFL